MKVIVIGGGMSGLTYAILSAKNGNQVEIFERNSRVGKKISMTGNGKCNIGNLHVTNEFYNKSKLVESVLGKITVAEYIKFLSCVGIIIKDKNGCLYPITESASSVVDCLRLAAEKLGVKICTDFNVTSVSVKDNKYLVCVEDNKYFCDKVVIACGLMSQAESPNIGNLIKSQYLTSFSPSLVPVKVKEKLGLLNGIRQETSVKLISDGTILATQHGDVQFKDYGLSGICILNLSAQIARDIVQGIKRNYVFEVDFCDSLSEGDLENILKERIRRNLPTSELFLGILKNKVAEYVLKSCKNISALELCHAAKHAIFSFEKLLDYSMSQVTCGGVDERYLNIDSLQLPNGVVVLGEALNVDGICGGYNLFFAGASALSCFTVEERSKLYNSPIF